MIIQLPSTFKGDQFTDREALFISFMFQIVKDNNFEKCWYNMHHYDFRQITSDSSNHTTNPFSKRYENLRNYFDFAVVDQNNILVYFKSLKAVATAMNKNAIGSYPHELKCIECIKTMCYLQGQLHSGVSILSETTSMIHYKEVQSNDYNSLKFLNSILNTQKVY